MRQRRLVRRAGYTRICNKDRQCGIKCIFVALYGLDGHINVRDADENSLVQVCTSDVELGWLKLPPMGDHALFASENFVVAWDGGGKRKGVEMDFHELGELALHKA